MSLYDLPPFISEKLWIISILHHNGSPCNEQFPARPCQSVPWQVKANDSLLKLHLMNARSFRPSYTTYAPAGGVSDGQPTTVKRKQEAGMKIQALTLCPPNYLIWIFTHLKLCLADEIHNFEWVKIIQIWQKGGQLFSNIANLCHISSLTCLKGGT